MPLVTDLRVEFYSIYFFTFLLQALFIDCLNYSNNVLVPESVLEVKSIHA